MYTLNDSSRIGFSRLCCLIAILVIALLSGCAAEPTPPTVENEHPFVSAPSEIDAGRYLVVVGGCNDCHTDNYLNTGGNVAEENWLLGSAIGWRGPWGTTYPSNLRMLVGEIDEAAFVDMLHTRQALPPMPWMNVNKLDERDAKAIYAFIQSLGTAGDRMPMPVAPDVEPETPYLDLVPKNLPSRP